MLKSAGFWTAVTFFIGLGFQVSGYQSQLVANGFFAISALLLIYAVAHHFNFAYPSSYVSLEEAAVRVFEKLRGTVWTEGAERLSTLGQETNEEKILNWMGQLLVTRSVPIYGKRTPSRVREQIPAEEFPRGGFVNKLTDFKYHGRDTRILYKESQVKKSDLRQAIAKLRKETI